MMSEQVIRVGIVGAGHAAEIHHLPVLAAMSDMKLAWICDLDTQRASTLARLYENRTWGEVFAAHAESCGPPAVAALGDDESLVLDSIILRPNGTDLGSSVGK